MEMRDFQRYETAFELALDGYAAELQGMPVRGLERGGRMIFGLKPVTLKKYEEKLALIKHVKAEVPYLFKERPREKYSAIKTRHYDALEAQYEAERGLLDDEELVRRYGWEAVQRRWAEYVSGLDDEERAIIEDEPRRLESCLRKAMRIFARQAGGELLKTLIDAVESRIEWRQLEDGEVNALLINSDREVLEFLKEFLPVERAAESAAVDGAADRPAPLPDVLKAVKQHKSGRRWPDSITGRDGEIQLRLFKVTGSVDGAIDLFCELYQCPECAGALDSAVGRKQKSRRKNRRKSEKGSV